MSDGSGGSVEIRLDGSLLRVHARSSRLVSLLRGEGGDPVLTVQGASGESRTEAVPSEARQVTFEVGPGLTVEATRGSDFVALSEEGGRRVVVAFDGEVTVLPTGEDGERFALGAHEALLVPADGGEPRVVPSDDLSDDDQESISSAMEAAALGASGPPDGTETPTPDDGPPTQPVPTVTEPATVAAAAVAGAAARKAAGNQNAKKGKKGKRQRPQNPNQPKKAAPLVPAAASAGAGGAASAAGKKTPPPARKAAAKTAKSGKALAAGTAGPGVGGGGRNRADDSPGDRRFMVGAVALAALIAVVLAVFVLTGDDEEPTDLAADATSTTAEPEATTTTEPEATTTSAAAAATSAPTTAAPTTTAPATTTTARPTTTTAAPIEAKYAIEPKSCVQNANSITYTATITNQSTVPFDYTIRVVFNSGDRAVASSDANVSRLAAGRSVDFTATGSASGNLSGAGTCDVERVDARPSGS